MSIRPPFHGDHLIDLGRTQIRGLATQHPKLGGRPGQIGNDPDAVVTIRGERRRDPRVSHAHRCDEEPEHQSSLCGELLPSCIGLAVLVPFSAGQELEVVDGRLLLCLRAESTPPHRRDRIRHRLAELIGEGEPQ